MFLFMMMIDLDKFQRFLQNDQLNSTSNFLFDILVLVFAPRLSSRFCVGAQAATSLANSRKIWRNILQNMHLKKKLFPLTPFNVPCSEIVWWRISCLYNVVYEKRPIHPIIFSFNLAFPREFGIKVDLLVFRGDIFFFVWCINPSLFMWFWNRSFSALKKEQFSMCYMRRCAGIQIISPTTTNSGRDFCFVGLCFKVICEFPGQPPPIFDIVCTEMDMLPRFKLQVRRLWSYFGAPAILCITDDSRECGVVKKFICIHSVSIWSFQNRYRKTITCLFVILLLRIKFGKKTSRKI